MKNSIIKDILAGLTVSFAALSLGAAFGIMSGRGAFAGMVGAAVIPIIASIFGGTKLQASGPTAPMTAVMAVLVANAYDDFGGNSVLANEFITLVVLLSSTFIIIAGLIKLGRFIQFVPQTVVLGFMNGIGVLIWYDQIKGLFGLEHTHKLDGNLYINIAVVITTLALTYLVPLILRLAKVPVKIRRFFPAMLLSILAVTLYATFYHLPIEHVQIEAEFSTFNDFLNYVAQYIPTSSETYSMHTLKMAIPFALQLCLLAYLDSLLTSLVIDKLTKTKTKPNQELIAQGLANGVSSILQGLPGAQATIRSVILVREGAQTRLAGILVGVFTLLGFVVFGNLLMLIPTAVFTGVLLKAGLDVMDRDFFRCYWKLNWLKYRNRNFQFSIILFTTIITVLYDLNVAVIVGSLLFYSMKNLFHLRDVETDFSMVESNEITG